MPTPDINITTRSGGLGRRSPGTDMVSGLVMNVSAAYGVAAGSYVYTSLTQAEAAGFSAAQDTAENVLCHYHISEFFRVNPSGTLHVMLVAQGVTLTQMADKSNQYAKKLLRDNNGSIKQIGLALNPATGYTPTITSGIDQDSSAAVPVAQALAEEEESEHRPVYVLIEGRQITGSSASILDARTLASENVSLVIGQDNVKASQHALFYPHAALGTYLGVASLANVHESTAWVSKFNIESVAESLFTSPGLSSRLPLTDYSTTDLDTLADKGFIFGVRHAGIAGVYPVGDATCTAASGDFAQARYVRTMNKAKRVVRAELLPLLGAPLYVDSAGKLSANSIKNFEASASKALRTLETAGEVSSFDVFVDPDQNVLSTDKVVVSIAIVPVGAANTIEVSIGFDNPNSN